MSKYRNFVFTLNNPTNEEIDRINRLDCRFLRYQRETGEESATEHLQGLICFDSPRSMRGVLKLLPRSHVEVMRGTIDQAYAYCSKEATRTGEQFEKGVRPAGQGSRSDIHALQECVKAGSSRREIFDSHFASALRFCRGIDEALRYYEPRRDFKTVVHWYWGPTGSGKSRAASIEAPEAYWKGSGKWWSGYDGHEDVIIDDYRREFFPYDELLRLLDRYPMSVETKGGHCQFRAKRIFITTCFDPYNTWVCETPENLQQLLRRIEIVKEFKNEL